MHVSVPCSLFAALLSVARPVLQATGCAGNTGYGLARASGLLRSVAMQAIAGYKLRCCTAALLKHML